MDSITNFITILCLLPQPIRLKSSAVTKPGEDSTCLMCPCVGNIHIQSLLSWFPYDGYHNVKLDVQCPKCSGKRWISFNQEHCLRSILEKSEYLLQATVLLYDKEINDNRFIY